ncbi:hypothetical protein HK103_003643 [Boothiomyces macroporosus]|uniref:Uncharacterized protein n=1 Tax=Boothiomyces macroporosus TaxID=261099 RepID=A0AAD5Y3W0_9FUNG|nr:hypothetical protein HK103_003643 [Boothiomyces macroporosus]
MQYEDQRLKSFNSSRKKKKFPSDIPGQSPEILSKLGFYHTPSKANNLLLTCFFCSKTIDCSDMHPLEKHLMDPCSYCLLYSSLPGDYDWNTGIQKRDFQVELLRDVFVGLEWPYPNDEQKTPTIDQMINGGFLFSPLGDSKDHCCCLYCDISLDGFEPDDDILMEHKKRSPDCIIVQLVEKLQPKKKTRSKKEEGKSMETVQPSTNQDKETATAKELENEREMETTQESTELEKPKRRGRPKKVVQNSEILETKENPKRGRKKKDAIQPVIEEPSVIEESIQETVVEEDPQETIQALQEMALKGKRGRKKKEITDSSEPKKRGRKKKEVVNETAVDESTISEESVIPMDEPSEMGNENDPDETNITFSSEVVKLSPKKRGRKKKEAPVEAPVEEKPKAKRGRKKKTSETSVVESSFVSNESLLVEDLADEKVPAMKAKRGRPKKNPAEPKKTTKRIVKVAKEESREESEMEEESVLHENAVASTSVTDSMDASEEPARKKMKADDSQTVKEVENSVVISKAEGPKPASKTEIKPPSKEQIALLTKRGLQAFQNITNITSVDLTFLTKLYQENQSLTVSDFHDLICDHVVKLFDEACQLELEKFK